MPCYPVLDEKSREIVSRLRQEAEASRNFCNFFSFSGIASIPLIFIGIAFGNGTLATASLCWLVSHFIGYITRMSQEEKDRSMTRLYLAENSILANQSPVTQKFTHRMSMN